MYIQTKIKTLVQKDTCTPVYIAVLLTIAKIGKQTKCPSTDKWIKMQKKYICTCICIYINFYIYIHTHIIEYYNEDVEYIYTGILLCRKRMKFSHLQQCGRM